MNYGIGSLLDMSVDIFYKLIAASSSVFDYLQREVTAVSISTGEMFEGPLIDAVFSVGLPTLVFILILKAFT